MAVTVTVEDLFEQWPSLAAGVRERSEETIERTARLARPFLVTFRRRLLVEFAETGAADVARWAVKHKANARYARTIMADAVLLGLIPLSPFAGVRNLEARSGRDFIPTREQVGALAEVGRGHELRVWVMTAAFSGGRLSALAGLRTRDIERLDNGAWRLHLARKGRPGKYPAPLLPAGRIALGEWLPQRADALIFRRPGGGPWDVKSISRCWVKMRRELGLPEECTSHCLRKFYATHLVDLGVSFEDVAIALDHVDERGRPNTEHVRAIYSLPDRDAALARVEGVAA